LRRTGPTTIAVTFRCNPDKKVALRDYMLKEGFGRVHKYKSQRVLKDYRVLFNSYLEFRYL
jgi:hypothetical protein